MMIALAILLILPALALCWPHFASKVLASIGFIAFGLIGLLEGSATFGEIVSDVHFLWTEGAEGDVYYGIGFDDY